MTLFVDAGAKVTVQVDFSVEVENDRFQFCWKFPFLRKVTIKSTEVDENYRQWFSGSVTYTIEVGQVLKFGRLKTAITGIEDDPALPGVPLIICSPISLEEISGGDFTELDRIMEESGFSNGTFL